MTTPHNGDWDDDLADVLQRLVTLAPPTSAPPVPPMPSTPPTVPPQSPPAAAGTGPVVDEWWRKSGPVVHTPVPLGGDQPAGRPSFEAAAQAFWAPVGRILTEQVPTIASQVGQQVTQLMTETEAQRAAREQVQYETLIAQQRAERDAAFATAGETAEQRAERHRVEQVLEPGHRRDDLVGMVDLLADRIGETPDERAARRRAEHELDRQRTRAREDAARAAAGETPEQRTRRHREQQLADRREARTRARRQRRRAARTTGPSDRVRRFRRWCVLTAISATGGWATGLVSLIAPGGPFVGLLVAAFGWALDLQVRDRGRQRVSEVTGPFPLITLITLRVPVASGLAVALGLGPVLAALPLN
ncbi:hypothetical protein [Kitasatospora purpeofusca]|uniref:hypothetical protein n=1 Tax=Kitasatospora purpeofusca TaxID=67352 RepID=UPI0004C20C1D|nr:hypothetical protein [Kitasatospora purpeofusca]